MRKPHVRKYCCGELTNTYATPSPTPITRPKYKSMSSFGRDSRYCLIEGDGAIVFTDFRLTLWAPSSAAANVVNMDKAVIKIILGGVAIVPTADY